MPSSHVYGYPGGKQIQTFQKKGVWIWRGDSYQVVVESAGGFKK